MKVSHLYLYPIKGMAGIEVTEAIARPIGFAYDRRWMLIDEDHKFVSQRNDVRLSQFRPEISEDDLVIHYGDTQIRFDVNRLGSSEFVTDVWGDQATTAEVSIELSQWFSDHLDKAVRLVRMRDEHSRVHHMSTRGADINVSLADGYPYLLLGSMSLDHLNSMLPSPVLINRFRPNIVVSTSVAHEEDALTTFELGSASFDNIKPCGRCQVITIDQQTGQIDNNILKTLNTYRKQGNSVMFGTNVVCIEGGVVKVGDSLNIKR
jgi:uncharacterized protein